MMLPMEMNQLCGKCIRELRNYDTLHICNQIRKDTVTTCTDQAADILSVKLVLTVY